MTLQTMLVLDAMLSDPAKRRFGLELCAETGQPSGTIYPILARLERFGWIEGRKESPAEHLAGGRRARYYYTLTDEGAARARTALERARRSRGPAVNLRTATS
ncbi:helix-turn-helix transcriptional regulator [Actinomadura sp. 6K520]|uniref:PadR family transcriptional regulator n=1 Tax=Actinomadura sp. 6K520 TaxID=2530364 RepID=UPI001042C5C3|nr:helix-turn-helix transcriptional regulator [Actinomadura sp. 6K520]TDE26525.1 PadR family transcriptional regulator [Actinomadura sp. 6K520]